MLTSYMYCKRKLYLQYVLKFFEPIKESTINGTIRHEAYDAINKEEENIVKSIREKKDLEELKEIYKNKTSGFLRKTISKYMKELDKLGILPTELFKKTWPLILEESGARATNVFNFMQQNLVFGEELWQRLTPKIKSEIFIDSDSLNLRGIVDQIYVYEQGVVPVELKTGKSPREGVWPGHKVQIAAYALLLQDKFKKDVKEGVVHYLDSNVKRNIPINPFLMIEIKDLMNSVKDVLSDKKAPEFTTNPNKCSSCGIKEQCYDNKLINNKIKVLNRKL